MWETYDASCGQASDDATVSLSLQLSWLRRWQPRDCSTAAAAATPARRPSTAKHSRLLSLAAVQGSVGPRCTVGWEYKKMHEMPDSLEFRSKNNYIPIYPYVLTYFWRNHFPQKVHIWGVSRQLSQRAAREPQIVIFLTHVYDTKKYLKNCLISVFDVFFPQLSNDVGSFFEIFHFHL